MTLKNIVVSERMHRKYYMWYDLVYFKNPEKTNSLRQRTGYCLPGVKG